MQNNGTRTIKKLLSVLLQLQEAGFVQASFDNPPSDCVVDVTQMISLLTGLMLEGYYDVILKEEPDPQHPEVNIIVIHPVTYTGYESYKPTLDQIELN